MNFGIRGRRALRNSTAALVTGACVAFSFAPALAEPQQQISKWGPHIDLEGKWGNRRSLGDIGLFAPLWQSPTSLFFTDIRGRLDDKDSREGNFGFGLRYMLPSGWNVGVYGYYDARQTGSGSLFQQATLGAELLAADFDLRVNGYLPFGTVERTIGTGGPGGAPFAEFANGTIEIVTPGSGQIIERALRGFDAEVGWRLPVFSVDSLTQIRTYAGGFWFDGGGLLRDIAGPRGRIEFSFEQPDGPWAGSRLILGAEVQHDDVRGTNAFAVARLRIPLQPMDRPVAKLTAQERRMTERVVRDVDIVAGEGKKGVTAETREAAINVYNSQTVTNVVQEDAADGQAVLQQSLLNTAPGSIVILNGSLNAGASFTQVWQTKTLLGGGAILPLQGATTGTAVNFVAPGAAGGLTGAGGAGVGAFANTVIGGLTIDFTGGQFAHAVTVGGNNVTVFGNTISTVANNSTAVLAIASGDNAKILNNTITTVGVSSEGIHFFGSAGGLANGNTITTPLGNAIRIETADNTTASANTVSGGLSGIRVMAGTNNTIAGNAIQTTGGANSVHIMNGAANVTIANNDFGTKVSGSVIHAEDGSSIVSAASINNADTSGNPRCAGDGTATGTVFFTNLPNCVYP